MLRWLTCVVVAALAVSGCSSQPASAPPDAVAIEAAPVLDAGIVLESVGATGLEPDGAHGNGAQLFLPDQSRWVVVDVYTSNGAEEIAGEADRALAVAPLSPDGVPQLHQLVNLAYRSGPLDEVNYQCQSRTCWTSSWLSSAPVWLAFEPSKYRPNDCSNRSQDLSIELSRAAATSESSYGTSDRPDRA